MISAVLLCCCLDWLLIYYHVFKDHTSKQCNSALVWMYCGTAVTRWRHWWVWTLQYTRMESGCTTVKQTMKQHAHRIVFCMNTVITFRAETTQTYSTHDSQQYQRLECWLLYFYCTRVTLVQQMTKNKKDYQLLMNEIWPSWGLGRVSTQHQIWTARGTGHLAAVGCGWERGCAA